MSRTTSFSGNVKELKKSTVQSSFRMGHSPAQSTLMPIAETFLRILPSLGSVLGMAIADLHRSYPSGTHGRERIMAAEKSTSTGALAVVFTSIVAPIVVNLTVAGIKSDETKPSGQPSIVKQVEAIPAQLTQPQPASGFEPDQRNLTTKVRIVASNRPNHS